MTPTEAQVLLTMASTFDNRKANEDAAKAWAAALGDLRFEDCRLALIEHYAASAEWIMPTHLRAIVKRIRAKRIAEAGDLTPPPGLTPRETTQWLGRARAAIGDGVDPATIPSGYGELKPRNLAELRAITAPNPSPADVRGFVIPKETPDA